MRYAVLPVCLFSVIAATTVSAEVPPMSFLILANSQTHFADVVPVVQHLRAKGVQEIDFATHADDQVAVTIRLRSDIEILTSAEIIRRTQEGNLSGQMVFKQQMLDEMARSLKEAGADQVGFERVPILPTASFSEEEFSKLRDQKQVVVVICRADWDVPSAMFNKVVMESQGVIRKLSEANIAVLVADVTQRPEDATKMFLKEHRATPLSVLIFKPNEESPTILRGVVSERAFLQRITETIDM